MDNNMKELSPDKFHLQAKMQEWLEANQEIYTDFKSKIQSILKNLLCDNHSKQIDDEAITLQSIILEVMTTEEGVATDELIDKFFNAIKDGNVSACCLYCYLELDNGLKEIVDGIKNRLVRSWNHTNENKILGLVSDGKR